jgi:hypothetical protein
MSMPYESRVVKQTKKLKGNEKLLNARIKEFKIPDEIMQKLGFSKVCVVGKVLVIYSSDDNCSIVKAPYYSNDLIKTTKALRDALSARGNIDEEPIDFFVACLTEVLLKSATEEYQATQEAAAQKQKENDSILDQIKKTRALLLERYLQRNG